MPDLKGYYLKQLDAVIELAQQYNSSGDFTPSHVVSRIITSAIAVINRIAGSDSVYGRQVQVIYDKYGLTDIAAELSMGVVYSLRNDIANDFLLDLREVIHGEVFNDFLDMADYLYNEGYKDAAAVIAGGVLESHLHRLCIKHGIDTEIVVNSDIKPKKADQLNADLGRKKVYNVLEQKNVTAWLDLRNKAAHAKYAEYTKDHVSLMLMGLKSFISRYPA